jgi:hypothetical protein
MSVVAIVDDSALSVEAKIQRLRDLEGNIRSLERALYPGEQRDDPLAPELAIIAKTIRELQQP